MPGALPALLTMADQELAKSCSNHGVVGNIGILQSYQLRGPGESLPVKSYMYMPVYMLEPCRYNVKL